MTNNFKNIKDSIVQSDFTSFESMFDVKLPDNYKNLILQFNGGVPERNVYVSPEGEMYVIHVFYSIKFGKLTLEKMLNLLQVWEQVIPKELLPIANDQGGNTYCISLAEDDYGKIYIWLHDVGGEKELVADSLEAFLENTITYEEWEKKQE